MEFADRVSLMLTHPRQNVSPKAEHFYVVDLMRGLAAIVVLVWHYQHFLLSTPGTPLPAPDRVIQPFYGTLKVFYEYGWYSVQLFWMISGFIFCSVYASSQSKTLDFVVNRLARLYPLHIFTLFIVAGLQILSIHFSGKQIIYDNNDWYHFILQLLFASNWGFQAGDSFNGPIWSVSLEVLVYTLFWITRSFIYNKGIVGPVALSLMSFVLMKYGWSGPSHFWECSFFFFSGTAVFLIFYQLREHGTPVFFVGFFLIIISLSIKHYDLIRLKRIDEPSLIAGILLCGCALEVWGVGRIAKKVPWISDNTYGCYLWHVPIQLFLLIIMDRFLVDRSIVLSPLFFISFIVMVTIVARVSFVYFESPARKAIRRKFYRSSVREMVDAP